MWRRCRWPHLTYESHFLAEFLLERSPAHRGAIRQLLRRRVFERHRIGAVTLIVLLSLLVFIPAFRGVRDGVFMDFLDIGLRYHLLMSTLRVCLGAFSCAWATPNNAWQSIRKFLPSTGVHSLMACIDSPCQCRDWPGSSLT